MFLSDPEFRQMLADSMKVDVADLSAYWDRQCQQAHESAYKDIRGALLGRGFTVAQVDAWDRGPEFEQDIGLFWAYTRGVSAKSLDEESLAKLDRRAELLSVMVETDAGLAQEPAGEMGGIVTGSMDVLAPDPVEDAFWNRSTPM